MISAHSELKKARPTEVNNLPKVKILNQYQSHGPEPRHSKFSACTLFFKKNNILLMHKQYMCDVKKFKYREAHMKKLKYHIPTT